MPCPFIVQHILAKFGMNHRQPFGNLRHPRLGRRIQRRPGADEPKIGPLQQPPCIRRQRQFLRPRMQRGHAGKQRRVQ